MGSNSDSEGVASTQGTRSASEGVSCQKSAEGAPTASVSRKDSRDSLWTAQHQVDMMTINSAILLLQNPTPCLILTQLPTPRQLPTWIL
jgi:hypothetical protein